MRHDASLARPRKYRQVASNLSKKRKEDGDIHGRYHGEGTLVKAGDYEIKFDEAAGTLSILRNGKVKATAPAHLEQRSDKAKNTSLRTVDKGANLAQLIAVTFGGSNQDVILGTTSAGAAGSQQ